MSEPRESQYRRSPLLDAWVILAEDRGERPSDFLDDAQTEDCPFCAGNEQQTPPPLAVYGETTGDPHGDDPAWRVRVVPNKYPAVRLSGAAGFAGGRLGELRADARVAGQATFEPLPGWGAHEVIVEGPSHVGSFTELTEGVRTAAMLAYRDRLRYHRETRLLAYALPFKNVGRAAGASLVHSHSQLVALPLVPEQVLAKLQRAKTYWRRSGRCLFCELVREERQAGQRWVMESDSFVAFCPYASRVPFETWILPRSHQSNFEDLSDKQAGELGEFVSNLLVRLEAVCEKPAYNYLIHTSPFDMPCQDYYDWHIELIPRMTYQAGFEWGTGCLINPVTPENAARALSGRT